VRLSLALLLALLVVPGFIVVLVLFANLGSHALAGHLAGIIFHLSNRGILILLLAIALFWWKREAGKWRWILLGAAASLVGSNELLLSPAMEHLKSAMGSIDALPPGDPGRAAFGMWHGASEVLHLLATLISVALVALGWGGSCKP